MQHEPESGGVGDGNERDHRKVCADEGKRSPRLGADSRVPRRDGDADRRPEEREREIETEELPPAETHLGVERARERRLKQAECEPRAEAEQHSSDTAKVWRVLNHVRRWIGHGSHSSRRTRLRHS